MGAEADATEERAVLSALVGAPVAEAERCAWGFENRTDIVTLADGRRLVVQRISNRAHAPQKIRLARTLPDRLAAVGVAAPRVYASDAQADPPYLIREYLPGAPGSTLLGSEQGALRIADEMGAILRRLESVEAGGMALHGAWANPARLARQARGQLERCAALIGAPASDALGALIDALPARFAGRGGRFAHGDFCPVNALVADGRVVALLDLEFARVADPLFDAAWWGWVVRAHHPDRWVAAWPRLLSAAGIAADAATLGRIGAIQRLRCLEALDYARTYAPARVELWTRHLAATLRWDT